MIVEGRIHRFGDHVDTDAIIPSPLIASSDPKVLGRGCFSEVEPGFADRIKPGDVIVAGENFGCGSSREHAPIAIQGCGIGCVVAASFSRIFFRSAINIGLPIVACPEVVPFARAGESARIDLGAGTVELAGRRFEVARYPDEVLEILRAGGLVEVMRHRIARGRGA